MSDDFDPDAYLAKAKAEPAFDPDAYLAKAAPAEAKPKQPETFGDKVTGALRAFKHKASFGLDDEIEGALGSIPGVGKYLAAPLWGDDAGRVKERSYTQMRDEARGDVNRAVKEYPVPATLGTLAAPVPKGLSMAKTGGLYGLLEGLGDDSADLTKGEWGKFAGNVVGDATAGLVTGKALGLAGQAAKPVAQYAGRKLEPVAQWLGDKAANRMTKAAGFIQKDLNKLPEGAGTKIGRQLLDAGLNKFGRTSEELLPGFKAARQAAGEDIGSILKSADEATGGAGPQIRSAVRERKAADEALRAAELDAERQQSQAIDSAMARAAAERAARRQAITHEVLQRDYSPPEIAVLKGKAREDAFSKLIDKLEAERSPRPVTGAPETFAGPGADPKALKEGLLSDLSRDRIPATDPAEYTKGLGFNLRKFTDAVRGKLVPEFSDPAFTGLKSDLTRKLAAYEQQASKGVSFSEANRMKSNLQKTISKFVDAPISQESKLKLQALLDDTIESQLGSVKGPETLEAFKAAKSKFGNLSEATRAATGATKRDLGNRAFSLTDLLAGLGGASLGAAGGHGVAGGALGLATAGVNHLARGRGSSAAAAALDAASKAAGKYAAALRGAAAESPRAFLAMHAYLEKAYPDYPAAAVIGALKAGTPKDEVAAQ